MRFQAFECLLSVARSLRAHYELKVLDVAHSYDSFALPSGEMDREHLRSATKRRDVQFAMQGQQQVRIEEDASKPTIVDDWEMRDGGARGSAWQSRSAHHG